MYFRIAIFFRLLNAHHTSDQLIRYLSSFTEKAMIIN